MALQNRTGRRVATLCRVIKYAMGKSTKTMAGTTGTIVFKAATVVPGIRTEECVPRAMVAIAQSMVFAMPPIFRIPAIMLPAAVTKVFIPNAMVFVSAPGGFVSKTMGYAPRTMVGYAI